MKTYYDILIRVDPDECDGRFVVPDGIRVIEQYAFQNCNNLKELVLPDGLERIKSFAFWQCNYLAKISFPDSLIEIGDNALSSTAWQKYYNGDFIMPTSRCLLKYTGRKRKVDIPDGVEHIADSAFEYTGVTSVKFPEGLKTIGAAAFRSCKRLESVKLPEGLESIGSQCFYDCTSLSEVYVPDSVKHVGFAILEYTLWHRDAVAKEGCVMLNNKTMIDYYGDETDIVLPEGIENIAADSFSNCSRDLRSMVLPEGVKNIGNIFLDYKRKLERVVIPSTLESWTGIAFMNSIIQQLELNFSVESSIYEVLEDNKVLLSASIDRILAPNIPISAMDRFKRPAAIGFVDMYMQGREFPKKYVDGYKRYIKGQRLKLYPLFSNNLPLAKFMCNEKMIPLEHIDQVIELAKDNFELRAMLMDYRNANFTFEDEEKLMMKELNKNPFSITELKKVWGYSINEDETLNIKSYKGEGGNVVIPEAIGTNKVSVISSKAFFPFAGMTNKIKAGRAQVKTVKIPDTVKIIEKYAFMCCNMLESAEISANTEQIGEQAFYCCKLKELHIPGSVKVVGRAAFALCNELESIVIEEGVEKLCASAFSGNKNVKTIWLPASLKYFGKSCFRKCDDMVIYAPKKSRAINYAKNHFIRYIEL